MSSSSWHGAAQEFAPFTLNPQPRPMLDDAMIDADTPCFHPAPTLPATVSPGKPSAFGFLDGPLAHSPPDAPQRRLGRLRGRGALLVHPGRHRPCRRAADSGARLQRSGPAHAGHRRARVVGPPGQRQERRGDRAGPDWQLREWCGPVSGTDEKQGQTMHAMGIWDRIGPGVCRWRQVQSVDGGKTWAHDWAMHWRRVA